MSEFENTKRTSFGGHIIAFIIMLILVSFVTMNFCSWLIVGLFFILALLFFMGYGISGLLGLIAGFILWFIGVFTSIINAIIHPFGLTILKFIGVG